MLYLKICVLSETIQCKNVASLSAVSSKLPQDCIHCCFCSSLSWWGTNVAQILRLHKYPVAMVRMIWFNSSAIIRTEKWQYHNNNCRTLLTFVVVLLVTGLPQRFHIPRFNNLQESVWTTELMCCEKQRLLRIHFAFFCCPFTQFETQFHVDFLLHYAKY